MSDDHDPEQLQARVRTLLREVRMLQTLINEAEGKFRREANDSIVSAESNPGSLDGEDPEKPPD